MSPRASARLRFWVAVTILCAPPFILGIQGTRKFDWPDEDDFFRDIAQAQSIADGHPLADPFYLGETLWYNPLVAGLVAGISKITGLPVHTAHTRGAPYLNILPPIVFAAFVARCFGPVASLVALTLFLYPLPWGRKGAEPFQTGVLYTAVFVQALFYLTLLVYMSLAERHRWRYVLTGLLLGLTALGHAGPSLVLGVFFVANFARDATQDLRGALRRYGVLFATAALVVSPLLVSLVGRYHLKVQNPAPMDWTTATSLGVPISLQTWAACVALVVLWIRGPRTGAWVVSGWIGSAIALLGYSLPAAAFGWPMFVPRHHFLGYAGAARPVLLGYGAAVLCSRARQWSDQRRFLTLPWATSVRRWTDWVATIGGASLVVLVVLPGYVRRATQRTGLVPDSAIQSGLDAYRWMRSVLHSDDVVLSTDDRALLVTGPAGAKVVALTPAYSNPYVDCDKRLRDRDEMFAALRRGDEARFEALAEEYSVTYVLWVGVDGPWFDHLPFRSLEVAFDNNRTRIYRRTAARRHPELE